MQSPPSAKEIKDAAVKTGCDAIPYPDLRDKGKKEYEKQKNLCKNFSCDSLTKENEIAAAQTHVAHNELRCAQSSRKPSEELKVCCRR
jgi:hypothetical protein